MLNSRLARDRGVVEGLAGIKRHKMYAHWFSLKNSRKTGVRAHLWRRGVGGE